MVLLPYAGTSVRLLLIKENALSTRPFHIAQFNVARIRMPLTDPSMQGFVSNLARINQLADAAPAFVWRLQTSEGDATSIRAYPSDDDILITLSVWESIDALANFTYAGAHGEIMRSRASWFHRIDQSYIVLWWIRRGLIPTVEEAKRRLDHLRLHGPTPWAFSFKVRFAPEEALAHGALI